MIHIHVILGLVSILIFNNEPKGEDIIYNRIDYIYNLKKAIDQNVWEGFTHRKFDVPLIYYTDSACYIANPTDKFIKSKKPLRVFKNKQITIYKTELLDSSAFFMETNMVFGTPSSVYNYRAPFMKCSSFEITQNFVPDVNSTEEWATMVMHEYFHGYQFKHKNFINHFEKNISSSREILKNLYKSHDWFKKSIEEENKMLLASLESNNLKETNELIHTFFLLRENRRMKTQQELNINIELLEGLYEKMEGTARYVEYSLFDIFSKKAPDHNLLQSDDSYQTYRDYHDYSIENDKWLYTPGESEYFYATGFNMVRLLEKLKVSYQDRLFKEGELALDHLIRDNSSNNMALKQSLKKVNN